MHDSITIETDLFEHREVKAHFINPCCFGEDFAGWLRARLSSLTAEGFQFADAEQEDYGWGFWALRGGDRFWIALSYVGDGPQEEPAQWVISVVYSAGLNSSDVCFTNRTSRLSTSYAIEFGNPSDRTQESGWLILNTGLSTNLYHQ